MSSSPEACLRAGLASGGRAIDIGCGPLGALPVLVDLVGSEGRVVGLDTWDVHVSEGGVLFVGPIGGAAEWAKLEAHRLLLEFDETGILRKHDHQITTRWTPP